MDFLGAVIVDAADGVAELGAAHDGILAEEEALALDEFLDGNDLHARDQVASGLILGHETARPGGGVFDEGPLEGHALFLGVTHGMASAGIGNARHDVHGVLSRLARAAPQR